jgi:hypothetical protein
MLIASFVCLLILFVVSVIVVAGDNIDIATLSFLALTAIPLIYTIKELFIK